MCHRKHYTWLFLRTECLACSLCCFRVDFTRNDCTRADIHVWVLRLLRWTSHQESRPSQLSAFGKHVPIRNGALRTGTKPSSAHPDTCVCSVTLESCLQEGTPSVTPPPGAQPQEGCHELLFPWHLQTKRWPPKRGCSATWGCRSPEAGREDREPAGSEARAGSKLLSCIRNLWKHNGSAGSKEPFPTTRTIAQSMLLLILVTKTKPLAW